MNRISVSAIKATAIGLVGSAASVGIGLKVSDIVYEKTEDLNVALTVGTAAGAVGLCATGAAMIQVVENDSKNYTDEDHKAAQRVNDALDTTSKGLKAVSNAMKLAAFLAG